MTTLASLYARSPLALQNLIVSGKGLHYRCRRVSTRRLRKHLAFLLGSQWWTPQQHAEYQLEQLKRVLTQAFEHVPYYRGLGKRLNWRSEDLSSLDDLRALPILQKNDVRGSEQEFVDSRFDLKRLWKGNTSGTTGTPLSVYFTREAMSRRWAFVARLRTWAGLHEPIWPKRVQFTGRNIVPDAATTAEGTYWRYNVAGRSLLMSTTHISRDTAAAYAAAMRRFRPQLVDGYPSALLMIARIAKAQGDLMPRPQAIITSAETLFPDQREEIETAYGCQVFDQYASSEPSCFWATCEHGNMHMSPEYGISEIVGEDGLPVQPGETGTVVVTSFIHEVMPLVRYNLGDTAVLGTGDACPCGRAMPRVERIVGRTDDILYFPGRGYIGRLDPIFKGLDAILEAQIVQEDLRTVCVQLVPAEGYRDEVARKLIANLRSKIGPDVNIRVKLVNHVPRGANGKFRSVVSKVIHPLSAPSAPHESLHDASFASSCRPA